MLLQWEWWLDVFTPQLIVLHCLHYLHLGNERVNVLYVQLGWLDLELWVQALLLALIGVKIMRNLSTAKIWWSILLPNCYTFPCIFVTSIWCEIKRITSTVLCLISLSIFSTCLLDNVQYSLIPMSSCFFSEWTHALTKFLKDQLSKIADFYQSHFAGITSSQHQQRMTPEVEQALKQWNYTVRLSHWLYEVRNLTYNSLYFHVWVYMYVLVLLENKNNELGLWLQAPSQVKQDEWFRPLIELL